MGGEGLTRANRPLGRPSGVVGNSSPGHARAKAPSIHELSFPKHSPRTPPRPHLEHPKPGPGLMPLSGASWVPGPDMGSWTGQDSGQCWQSEKGQENAERPRLPLPRQKAGQAPRGCPGQGKADPRPPGQQHHLPAHLPDQGLLLSATNTLHGPETQEPEPRLWAGVLGPQVQGAGAESCGLQLVQARPLPAAPRPSLATGSCPRLSPHPRTSWTPCPSESQQGPQT